MSKYNLTNEQYNVLEKEANELYVNFNLYSKEQAIRLIIEVMEQFKYFKLCSA